MFEALAFLTILPVPANQRAPRRRSLVAFPLVGLLVGAVWVLVAWGATQWWGPLVAAAAVSIVDLMVTGGIHLDAVADLADGWASRKPAAEARRVMRDPAIGAVGAAVLGIALLTRFSLLALAASQAAASGTWLWLAVPTVAGRAAMAWMLGRARPAEAATPASLTSPWLAAGGKITGAAAAVAFILVTGLSALRSGHLRLGDSGLGTGLRGLGGVAAALALAEVGLHWTRRRFGNLAGDSVGAVGIAAEIVALAVLTARR